MEKLPLDGVRVADFSWVIAGPYATMWLAVMGAEVVRIETNQHIDVNRRGQPFAGGIAGENRSGLWNSLNFAKLSCNLNLAKPKAADLARQLVSISDVVVENFAYGQMARFGLGYAELRKLKPDLILVSSSGVGRTGPERGYVSYNEQLVAYSGLASLTGNIGGAPTNVGGFWADHLSATALAFAILAALRHRTRTGEGQDIDISMTEAVMSQLPQGLMDYAMNKRVPVPLGNRDAVMVPHGVYHCKGEDKWVAIAVSTEEEWRSLCQAMGDPPWTREKKFADPASRRQNLSELDDNINAWTRERSHYEVMEILQGVGVAAGPSVDIEELVNDPHLREREFFVSPNHLETGRLSLPGLPCKLSAHPTLNYAPSPLLGQHNEYVFLELLGLSDQEFAELIGEGVIL